MTSNVERSDGGSKALLSPSASRILVVDDNQVIRMTLSGVIRQDPRLTVVGEASSGEMALEAVKALQPDLVCLDVIMPGIGGLATLKRMREEHPAVRTIIITAEGTSEILKEALAAGANGFVVKPFSAAKVLSAIHTALTANQKRS
jgi:two-component system, chemotaxis family, chemotaxis protein CheY